MLLTLVLNALNTLIKLLNFPLIDWLSSFKELDELIKVYKRKLEPKGRVYIFIDEIQNIT